MTRRISAVRFLAATPLLVALAACQGGSGDAAADSAAARDSAAAAAPPPPAPTDSAAAVPAVPAAAEAQGAMLDPNTATREQLIAASGLPAHAVDALIAGRPYENMVAVNRALVAHVPDSAARKTAYARVWKPIDLNTATDEEILLIPGVGRRMLREFKEYRPYRNIERFRREMGKYVDSTEVARLERYVMIR